MEDDAVAIETSMLLMKPVGPTTAFKRKLESSTTTTTPGNLRSKKTLRERVRELQRMVNELRAQVSGANAKILQLVLLVGLCVQQRVRRHEEEAQASPHRLFEQNELEMDIEEQQRYLQAQIKYDYEVYIREQQHGRIEERQNSIDSC